MADNVDVIQGIWDAFGNGDVDKAANYFADDAQVVAPDPLPWGGTHVGPDGFRDFAELLSGSFRDLKARPIKVLGADDNHVTVLAHTSGKTQAGKPLEVDVLWLYQLRDARVISAHAFTDSATILEALDWTRDIRVSVVVVAHHSAEALERALPALDAELAEGDELIVVDNASTDGSADVARQLAPGATVIDAGANLGYGAGNNRGAAVARGELLVFLNPDAVVQAGFREAIVAPAESGLWAAWQGLVTADGGAVVNTRGGVVHFTGIAWAGGAGEPFAIAAQDDAGEPGFVSGACLAIPRERFVGLGGFAEEFFLYQEDVDLSLRIRLAGGRLGIAYAARADHDYEFDKGAAKWRYLERNRWATIIRTYPGALLALTMPALIATDIALWPVAIASGWAGPRWRALRDTLRTLPRLLRERREIQATSAIEAGEFARTLTADLDSGYLGAAARSRVLGALLRAYWRIVTALLKV